MLLTQPDLSIVKQHEMTTKTQQSILDHHVVTATTGVTAPYFEANWPAEYLEPFMKQADPLADKIIQLLYAEGRRMAERTGNPADRPGPAFLFLNLLINRMTIPDPDAEHPFADEGSDYTFAPEVADALRTFINEAKNLPDWADPDLMREAQRLFSDNPLLAYPLLAFLSLPVLYTCGRGATQSLLLTDQINTKVRRRIVETGSLIMQVMQQDAFTKFPDPPTLTHPVPIGIEAILRVRLLHAASRTIIYEFWQDGLRDRATDPSSVRVYQNKPADQIWKAEWGLPISQQYLAGTLMSFSYLDLFGLEQLGVIVTDDDKKAYMHFWNVFGHVLGIDKELLLRLDFPRTGTAVYAGGKPVHDATAEEMMAVGRALYARVMLLNRATDQQGMNDGRTLTKAITDYMADVLVRRVPAGKWLRVSHLPHLMMAMLLSKDDRALLGVKVNVIDRLFFPIVMFVLHLRGALAKTVGLPATALANLFFHYMQEENNAVYDELAQKGGVRYTGVPSEFQEKWGET